MESMIVEKKNRKTCLYTFLLDPRSRDMEYEQDG